MTSKRHRPMRTDPPVTFRVTTGLCDSVVLSIESEGMDPTRPTMTPEFSAQLAAELVFIASRVAGKDMRAVCKKYLRERKGGAR